MRITVTRSVLLVALFVITGASCTPVEIHIPPGTSAPISTEHIQTFNVAFMGDSYAAGEGNPDARLDEPGHALWWSNRQCHRSTENGRIAAVEALNDPVNYPL